MGHKTHPLGFRLGITQQHKSKWYANLNVYSQFIQEDETIRNVIFDALKGPSFKATFKSTGITKILLHRSSTSDKINLEVQTAKPGVLVGTEGFRLHEMDQKLSQLFPDKKIIMNIVEITNIYHNAEIVADKWIIKIE